MTDPADVRKLRKHLKSLCHMVELVLTALDSEMKKPADVERGRRVAAICNVLEMENDVAKHFGLGLKLGKKVS